MTLDRPLKKQITLCIIISIITLFLTGCAKRTTIYSTLKVNIEEIGRVEDIVHNTFVELGFQSGVKKRSYWKFDEKSDRPIQYSFTVTYKALPEHIVVKIQNRKLKPDDNYTKTIDQYLSNILEIMNKKFADDNLNVIIERGSHWIPDLYM